MGKAILNGLISGKIISPDTVFVHNHSPASTDRVAQEFGVHGETQVQRVAEQSDIIFIGVKPYAVPGVLRDISLALKRIP